MNRYTKGDDVNVSADFSDRDGVLLNPTTVACKIKNPAGTITTYTYPTDAALVRDATGKYHVEVQATTSGRWHYRFEATGIGMAAGEGGFLVENSVMD